MDIICDKVYRGTLMRVVTEEGRKRMSTAALRGNDTVRKRNRREYCDNVKFCLKCDKSLPYEKRHNKFCNHSCAANNNNLGVTRHGMHRTCLDCGKPISNSRKYCGMSCRTSYRYNLIIKNNMIFSNKQDKKHLIKIRGNRCEICGVSERMSKPLLLIIDHIDGNSDDNSLDNIRLICSNCDAQTPTYKSKNKGKGRFYRRQRYADGRSY